MTFDVKMTNIEQVWVTDKSWLLKNTLLYYETLTVSLHSWHAAEYFCSTEKQHYEEHHIYEKESHGLEQNEGE